MGTKRAQAPRNGLQTTANEGDRLVTLETLRDRLAAEIERVADEGFCPVCKRGSSGIAPLAAQFRAVLEEIDELRAAAPPVEGTPLDELQRRRAERKPAAAS